MIIIIEIINNFLLALQMRPCSKKFWHKNCLSCKKQVPISNYVAKENKDEIKFTWFFIQLIGFNKKNQDYIPKEDSYLYSHLHKLIK